MRYQVIIIIGCLLSVTGMVGCSNPFGSDDNFRTFLVKVDSVRGPSTFAVSDTMKLTFHGDVGPDGCYSFSHFDTTRIEKDINTTMNVRVWGKVYTDGRICPAFGGILKHKLEVYPISSGNWVFTIHQPDNSTLRKEVVVR